MKIQVRKGVFETNSSSTHSITITTKDVYDKWVNGELVLIGSMHYCDNDGIFMTPEEAKEKGHDPEDYNYITYDKFEDDYDLEGYYCEQQLPSGETVVVFGKYGYDG